MGIYDTQIFLLETLIENWYEIKTPKDYYRVFGEAYKKFNRHHLGLCATCKFTFNTVEMFSSWEYYSGDWEFPVGGYSEYKCITLITDNPKRLHLAVHCLRYLREHNEERW